MYIPLTAYQLSGPITRTAPSVGGVYRYYIQCRNTTKTYVNTTEPVDVTVFSCNDVTDVPVAECQALMSIYNNNGGENWYDQSWGASAVVDNWT